MTINNKVLKSRVLKCEGGTPRGGLVPKQESGTWGDRGKGNEIQTGLEKGLSWIWDKIVNSEDYINDGFNYLVTTPIAAITGKTKEVPRVVNLMRLYRNSSGIHHAVVPFDSVSPIKGGWMLKGLMKGSSLEKQLSKVGTININGLQAYLNKASKLELDVINKVLSTKFAGLKNIDYNELRKAVSDELITYSRVPQVNYEDYGIEGLGFKRKPFPERSPGLIFGVEDFMHDSELNKAFPYPVKFNTFTFESPRIPYGNSKHYNGTTLGHSRTYTTPDEPDVLHIMESQSDWAQSRKNVDFYDMGNTKEILKLITSKLLKNKVLEFNNKYPLFKLQFLDFIKYSEQGDNYHSSSDFWNAVEDVIPLKTFKEEIEKIITGLSASLYKYLLENYLSRQLQENMKYAAEQGHKKMRYPTSETAAKIEGYEKTTITDPKILEEYRALDLEKMQLYNEQLNLGIFDRRNYIIDKRLEEIKLREQELSKMLDYSPEHQTILKKYADFPKMFGKLFKGLEVRTVTDPKGNTWYEVDIPANFLQSEWQFKKGGALKNKPTLISKVKKHLGGGLTYSKEQEAVKRALASKEPASNYSDAVDMNIWKPREVVTDWVLRLGNFFGVHAKTGLSNCTLTASQWVNPKRPIGRAASIVTDPGKHLFSQIPEEYAIPGTLVIASKDPAQYKDGVDNVYHTMLLTGFADKDYDFLYNDKTYKIKKGEPLVDYSRGKNMSSELRRNIPLSVYNDLGEGKTFNRFYKPQDSRIALAFLPEVTIKPQ